LLNGDGKLDEKDIESLDQLRGNIIDAYSRGNLNEKDYENLKNETSVHYEKIFRRRIDDALNNSNNYSSKKIMTGEQLAQLRKEIKYAYSEGKINDKHYDLLNKDFRSR
jgi:hypothetical protein